MRVEPSCLTCSSVSCIITVVRLVAHPLIVRVVPSPLIRTAAEVRLPLTTTCDDPEGMTSVVETIVPVNVHTLPMHWKPGVG